MEDRQQEVVWKTDSGRDCKKERQVLCEAQREIVSHIDRETARSRDGARDICEKKVIHTETTRYRDILKIQTGTNTVR